MRRLVADSRGSMGLEFALAIPILVALIIGVLQFGLVLNANGSMRHAMGEGLRLAKVDPTASDSAVLTRTRQQLVGVDPNGVTSLTFARGTANNVRTGTMTMTVQLTPVIPFAPIPPIVLTQTKKVYLPV
ncbi:pilus assembly protein [Qipengyuania sp. 6B39]|uniref:TadE/TadG family type IV pilus assembly protein n=1 Tax=Qipengyuania proteolytica TaxID=2867239 RepID=UPI001C8AF0DB|nr:TadE/TadG family type IV pilus assembly protein [Qipengyuania proteolytica]MBX7496533.1 pilus assembly protein [Qipengyuania proteolytica]